MPNFVEIGQAVAEIWRQLDFSYIKVCGATCGMHLKSLLKNTNPAGPGFRPAGRDAPAFRLGRCTSTPTGLTLIPRLRHDTTGCQTVVQPVVIPVVQPV